MPQSFRLLAALVIGSSGLGVMLAMSWPIGQADWSFLLAATLGAASAGHLCAPLFGLPRRRGLHLCMLGAFLATAGGAALAGLGLGFGFGLGLSGLLLGPVAVVMALLNSPALLAIWLGSMALAQWVLTRARRRVFLPG